MTTPESQSPQKVCGACRQLIAKLRDATSKIRQLTISGVLCRFGWHNWDKWQDIDDPNQTNWHWHQKRYCKDCNIGIRRWTE